MRQMGRVKAGQGGASSGREGLVGREGQVGHVARLARVRWSARMVLTMLGLLILVGPGTTSLAFAQTATGPAIVVSAGSGWGALWDDETNLGRGAPVAGSAAVILGGRLRAGVDVDWTSHVRDSGYLRTEGQLTGAFGRVTYMFGTPDSQVRPLFGVGLGVMHSTGTLITSSVLPGPTGLPIPGPEVRQPWSLTRAAYDLHGGVHIRLTDRLALRPEGRWRATLGSAASSSIEPPLIAVQTMVHLDVKF